MPPPTLAYASDLPTSHRYEWELESERARWLRRRFLWFCGIGVTISILAMISDGFRVTGDGTLPSWTSLIGSGLKGGVAVAAMLRIGRRRVEPRRLYRLVFAVVVAIAALELLELRLDYEWERYEHRQSLVATEGNDGAVAGAAGRAARGAPSAIGAFFVSLWVLFALHLLACLFFPWRVSEAIRPAAAIAAMVSLSHVVDVSLGRVPLESLLGLAFIPVVTLPGLGWCWWRYSRFRDRYRFVFESQSYRRLRQDLDGARRIHEASLPPNHTVGPIRLSYVYEPMQQIGGDLLFVHPRPPTKKPAYDRPFETPAPPRHTMVLMDVTGHGIAAALTVNRLVGELERIFAERPDISCGELLAQLNRYAFLTISTHGIYVTAVAISVDTSIYSKQSEAYTRPHPVCFSSAGHPTAFLRRLDGTIHPLRSNAMMLGVLGPDEYEPAEELLNLEPGDALVAYTDGAAEARNARGRMIGIDGVRDLLAEVARELPDPAAWPGAMIRRVAAWRSAPADDDTLLAVVYRPGPAEAAKWLADHMPTPALGQPADEREPPPADEPLADRRPSQAAS